MQTGVSLQSCFSHEGLYMLLTSTYSSHYSEWRFWAAKKSHFLSENKMMLRGFDILVQCFHFEGNFLNSGKSWPFLSNCKMRKKNPRNCWKCEYFNKLLVDTCKQSTAPCSHLQNILRVWRKYISRKFWKFREVWIKFQDFFFCGNTVLVVRWFGK